MATPPSITSKPSNGRTPKGQTWRALWILRRDAHGDGPAQASLPVLQEGIAASPRSMVVNFELGRVLFALDQPQQAQHFLEIAENSTLSMPKHTIYWEGFIISKSGLRKRSRSSKSSMSWTRSGQSRISHYRSLSSDYVPGGLSSYMLSRIHPRKAKRRWPPVFLLIAPAFAQQLDDWTVSHFERATLAQQANDLQTAETEYRASPLATHDLPAPI